MAGHDVFLSYTHADRARVEQLAAALSGLGFDVWYDQAIASGQSLSAVDAQLRAAKCAVVCWSRAAAKSEWMVGEAHVALDIGSYVAVALEACDPPAPFSAKKIEGLQDWNGEIDHHGFRRLVRAIEDRTLRPATALLPRTSAPNPERRRSYAPAQIGPRLMRILAALFGGPIGFAFMRAPFCAIADAALLLAAAYLLYPVATNVDWIVAGPRQLLILTAQAGVFYPLAAHAGLALGFGCARQH